LLLLSLFGMRSTLSGYGCPVVYLMGVFQDRPTHYDSRARDAFRTSRGTGGHVRHACLHDRMGYRGVVSANVVLAQNIVPAAGGYSLGLMSSRSRKWAIQPVFFFFP